MRDTGLCLRYSRRALYIPEVAPLYRRIAILRREDPVLPCLPEDLPIFRFLNEFEFHCLSLREGQIDVPVVCVLATPAVLHLQRLVGVPLSQALGAAGNIDRLFALSDHEPGGVGNGCLFGSSCHWLSPF